MFGIKSSLESYDSRELFTFPAVNGGDKRDRTADLLNAIQALSQLSYTPILNFWFLCPTFFLRCKVGNRAIWCNFGLVGKVPDQSEIARSAMETRNFSEEGGRFTGQLPSQLSYTPRCGKKHLLSFVEGCVTSSTGLPAELYPHICDATGPPCSTQVISYQKPCGLSTIKIKFFLFPKTYRLLSNLAAHRS